MKPVNQTRFGANGNCLAACIASILEVPIELVDFTGTEGDWLEKAQAALRSYGFFYLGVNIADHYTLMAMPANYCIFTGKTERNPEGTLLHCVVGILEPNGQEVIFKTVHDPNIQNPVGILGKPTELGFLVLRNPHRFNR